MVYTSVQEAMIPDPRESKLPLWARAEIDALRREVDDRGRTIEALRLDNPVSQVYYREIGTLDSRVYLPERARVSFDFAGKGKTFDEISVGFVDDVLRIQAGYRLEIIPQATNALDLKMTPPR